MLEELIDRFGDLPKQVMNLLKISYIKSLGSKGKVSLIKQLDGIMKIEFIDKSYLSIDLINEMSKRLGNKLKLDSTNLCNIRYKYSGDNQEEILDELEDVIGKIGSLVCSENELK